MKQVIYDETVFRLLVGDYMKYCDLTPIEDRLTFHKWAFEINKTKEI